MSQKFPNHISKFPDFSLTFPGLQNSLTIPDFPRFPGLWEPCLKTLTTVRPLVTDHFSDRSGVCVCVCVCVSASVRTITFERNDP